MVLQPEDRLKKTDQAFLKFLYNKAPEIKAAVEMAVQFKSLFKNKEEGPLESWLTRALQPESELRSFAQGVKHDYSAINQVVISVISNGQVEGQVNKLKNIKRMMYGRANFPLLKKMVLHESMVHQK
ncbi:transposase [Gillisia sp. Hel_I_86]|nr:transposase [Gillisia sp. Hel_I_86]